MSPADRPDSDVLAGVLANRRHKRGMLAAFRAAGLHRIADDFARAWGLPQSDGGPDREPDGDDGGDEGGHDDPKPR